MIRTEQTDKKETLVDLLCKNIRMEYHYAAVSAWTEASNEGAGCEIWHERDTSEAGFESPDE